jgi:hypothetical protein
MVREELFQFPCGFIIDVRKLNPIANLGVASRDYARGTQHHAIQPKFHRQRRPNLKCEHRLDIAATGANVAG